MLIIFAAARACFLAECEHTFTDTQQDWGYTNFCSTEAALPAADGFFKDGELLLGAHISVRGVSTTDACACITCEYTADVAHSQVHANPDLSVLCCFQDINSCLQGI